MARTASSASSRRRRSSSFSRSSSSVVKVLMTAPPGASSLLSIRVSVLKVQSGQDPLPVGQVADQAALRVWQHLDESGGGDDLLVPGPFGLQVEVDDLQVVPAGQPLLAHVPQPPNGLDATRRPAG